MKLPVTDLREKADNLDEVRSNMINKPTLKKSNTELIAELNAKHEIRYAKAQRLLENIKNNRAKIRSTLNWFYEEEADLVYRFYHQSFKVFIMNSLIEKADNLFKELAPTEAKLNAWYRLITKTSLSREFDASETNEKWIGETTPLLLAFWNAKYFLEQMLVAADELDEAPQILPSGWAAVLYLYDLR